MVTDYQCDGCGACCRTHLVDLYEVDLLREPLLKEHVTENREPGLDGEIGYLAPSPDLGCPLLDETNRCSIYPTRPSVCVLFPAGSEKCQEARRSCGLEPLRTIRESLCVSTTPVVEDGAMTRQNEARQSDRNGGRQPERPRGDRDGGERQRPVHEVRLGRIKAAIWENATETGTRHNVTVSRIYKDGDQWKDSTSFGRDDLPLVAKVCDLAHTWIYTEAGRD